MFWLMKLMYLMKFLMSACVILTGSDIFFVSDFLTFQIKMWPSLGENSRSDLKFEQLPPSPASARPAKSSPTLRSWAQLSNCQVFSSINWTDCCPKFYHLLRRFLRDSFTPVLILAATTTSWWLVSSSSFYMMLSFVSIFDILEVLKYHDLLLNPYLFHLGTQFSTKSNIYEY